MKRLLLAAVCVSLFVCAGSAQDASQAAGWAKQNKTVLAPIADASLLKDIIKQGQPGFDSLAKKIVTAGKDDPVAATTIASLTQYVLQHPEARPAYAKRVLAAAKAAKEPDMINFWLCQLRWCGTADQVADMKPLLDSQYKCVRDLAAMAVQSMKECYAPQEKQGAWLKPTAAEKLSKELAAMKPDARLARCVEVYSSCKDQGCITVAVQAGTLIEGEKATKGWMAAYEKETCPAKKGMLLDLFKAREDWVAAPLLEKEMLNNPCPCIALNAMEALIVCDRGTIYTALPSWLEKVDAKGANVLKTTCRRLPKEDIVPILQAAYPKASATGKKVSAEVLKLFGEEKLIPAK